MLRRNVLIFHAGALGDFVLSWPLAMALGRLYPQSRVICVCAQQKGKLFESALRLESVDVENGFSSLFVENGKFPDNVNRLLAGAHTICSFVTTAESVWARNVATISPEAVTVFIDPTLPIGFDRHASVHLLMQLTSVPVIRTAVEQLLRSIAERGLGLPIQSNGPIIIHPGAGSPAKCWPLDCFRKLSEQLTDSGRDVKWIVGEVEIDRWPASDIANCSKSSTLLEFFQTLRTASAFVGNDSGPSHLAGILGVPTVAIFGSTNPALWKPLGPSVRTVAAPSIDQVRVEEVLQAING